MRNALIGVLCLVVLALLLVAYNLAQPATAVRITHVVGYSELLTAARSGQVRRVVFRNHELEGTMATDPRPFVVELPDDPTLAQRLAEQGVQVSARADTGDDGALRGAIALIPSLFFLGVLALLTSRVVRALRRVEAALGGARAPAVDDV